MKKESSRKEMKIETLAQMVAKGLNSIDVSLKTIHSNMKDIEKRLTSRLDELEETLTNRIMAWRDELMTLP